MKIIFIGTPNFAVESLKQLLQHNYNIVCVVTAPDKASGRGMQMQKSAVKIFAEQQGLKILHPINLKNPEFINHLKSFDADLQIVVAFRMLPEIIWNMPSLGTINVHASLLPNYRGAAPIQWAIINGETETGVTTFRLQHQIDTGNILLQKQIEITDTDTGETLYDKLKISGAELLIATLQRIQIDKNFAGTEQKLLSPTTPLKHAPKIFKEHALINWKDTGEIIINLIRGLNPTPAAYTLLNNKALKIFNAYFEREGFFNNESGKWDSDNSSYLKISCSNGWIFLDEMQLEGKKRMLVKDFLNGNKIL